jgi:NlpC/P60 family putative phage cell wall peptidase
MTTREAFLAEARAWIGTPFRHGTALRGLGCDCLGLVVGVRHRLAGGDGPAPMPAYAPDWAEAGRRDVLAEACAAALPAVEAGDARPGDILLFRWRRGRPACHLAILVAADRIVHAHVGLAVVEVFLPLAWRRRVAAVHRFPEPA